MAVPEFWITNPLLTGLVGVPPELAPLEPGLPPVIRIRAMAPELRVRAPSIDRLRGSVPTAALGSPPTRVPPLLTVMARGDAAVPIVPLPPRVAPLATVVSGGVEAPGRLPLT